MFRETEIPSELFIFETGSVHAPGARGTSFTTSVLLRILTRDAVQRWFAPFIMLITVLETKILRIFPLASPLTIPRGREIRISRELTLSFIIGTDTL